MGVMTGKRGLVMGVANDHSIAWGIASTLAEHGAEMAFTYQGDAFGKRVQPLAESVGSKLVLPADVQDPASLDTKGRYSDTTRENFLNTMDISCFSLTDLSQRCIPLMKNGGSIITLTYLGAERVLPNYNVMGVAKAALEASVRYLAADLGPNNIRVNAVSPGPMRTLAGSAVGSARKVFKFNAENAPLRRTASLSEVGGAALYLLSDLGGGTTGETLYVDGGYHAMGMVAEENL